MDDMEGQVRESLRRRADDVPPQLAVPPSLAGRAHRRFAMNAIGVAVVLAFAAAGFAVLRTGDQALVDQPGGSPPVSTAACTAADLRATAVLEGAMGSREGEIVLTNVSDAPCTLEGTPETQLFDTAGGPITRFVEISASDPGWLVNGDPKPDGWPVVTVQPGERASVRIRWSNWCSDQPLGTWNMRLGDAGGIVTVQGITAEPPPCNGSSQPSTIEVGPFEPRPS